MNHATSFIMTGQKTAFLVLVKNKSIEPLIIFDFMVGNNKTSLIGMNLSEA